MVPRLYLIASRQHQLICGLGFRPIHEFVSLVSCNTKGKLTLRILRCTLLLVAAVAFTVGIGESVLAHKWVDASGKRSTEAEFIALESGKVKVKKDGRIIFVRLEDLSKDSQEQAKQLDVRAKDVTRDRDTTGSKLNDAKSDLNRVAAQSQQLVRPVAEGSANGAEQNQHAIEMDNLGGKVSIIQDILGVKLPTVSNILGVKLPTIVTVKVPTGAKVFIEEQEQWVLKGVCRALINSPEGYDVGFVRVRVEYSSNGKEYKDAKSCGFLSTKRRRWITQISSSPTKRRDPMLIGAMRRILSWIQLDR